MRTRLLIVCAVCHIGTATQVLAQDLAEENDARPVRYEKRLRTDFRLGTTWSDGDSTQPTTVGASLLWHPVDAPLLRRAGLYYTVDYRQLSRSEDTYPCAGESVYCSSSLRDNPVARGATTRHWVARSGGVSVDLIRSRRFALDVRGGGGSIDEPTTFELWRKPERVGIAEAVLLDFLYSAMGNPLGAWEATKEKSGGFQNVCDWPGFREFCTHDRAWTSHWGSGARFFDRTGTRFFGVDYTHLRVEGVGNSRHQLVGVVGIRFPFRANPTQAPRDTDQPLDLRPACDDLEEPCLWAESVLPGEN